MKEKLRGLKNPKLWDFFAINAEDEIQRGGWYNSFDGAPFSKAEMEQYVENTFVKVRPYLKEDARVLEIGCASGLTMFKLSPFVREYIGTDIAKENLRLNQDKINDEQIRNISLIKCGASEINEAVEGKFDLIIINSVCQYFPGMEYFEDVIEKCIHLLVVGGALLLGDLLDNSLQDIFVAELKEWKEQHENSKKVKLDRSDELWIDRLYFNGIGEKFRAIKSVDVSDKMGKIHNELTKYRYDVIIST